LSHTSRRHERRSRSISWVSSGVTSRSSPSVNSTRIAEALHLFNRHWSRRVLGGGAVVLLFTDGLESARG
jgi:uncharacterized protein with von Willebrand factor type A (vWA) domain